MALARLMRSWTSHVSIHLLRKADFTGLDELTLGILGFLVHGQEAYNRRFRVFADKNMWDGHALDDSKLSRGRRFF
jgi:hypothetical protein